MATKNTTPPMGTAENTDKSELTLADVLRNVDSLHHYRQGYGLYSHKENRFLSATQIEALLSIPLPENNYKPLPDSALTLLILINDLIYSDVKTIRFFLPLARFVYSTSMPSDPAMIDTLMQQFQHLHLVCKREQRAGKTDYERPLDNIRVACSCITADGSRLVASQFMHPATDVRGLSLPMLDETSAYGLTVANFLMVAFARTYIPVENLDPYYKTIEIHFPKFKYIREYADDFGNTSVSPGRIIFPSRVMESTGLKTRRKACIFTSQLLGYNTALISADKFEKTRKHILEMARWSANREKGKAEEYEVVETAVFVAVENMAGAIKIRDDLVALLESGDVEHVYVTTEAAVDEFCIKRRCVLQAALIELRRDPVTGEYKYKSPDATFFR